MQVRTTLVSWLSHIWLSVAMIRNETRSIFYIEVVFIHTIDTNFLTYETNLFLSRVLMSPILEPKQNHCFHYSFHLLKKDSYMTPNYIFQMFCLFRHSN
jgi:hypothetical protein